MISDTQHDSWEGLQPSLPEKRARVLQLVPFVGGATLWQLAERLGWPINCVSGRVTELRDLGLIRDSGRREKNPRSGKKTIVWIRVGRETQQEFFGDLDPRPHYTRGH